MLPDGKPLTVMQGLQPQPIMLKDGTPATGEDGKPLLVLPVGPGQVRPFYIHIVHLNGANGDCTQLVAS
jgi:hypothetical protein